MEQKPKVEILDYRTMTESVAVDQLIENYSSEDSIQSIVKTSKINFSWPQFWINLNNKRAMLSTEMLVRISRLSNQLCSKDNSDRYLILVNNSLAEKRSFGIDVYLKLVTDHVRDCHLYISQEQVDVIRENVLEKEYVILKSKEASKYYIQFLSVLLSKTTFVTVNNSNKLINEDVFRSSLANAIENEDLDHFNISMHLFKNIFPNRLIQDFVNISKNKVSSSKMSILLKEYGAGILLNYLETTGKYNEETLKTLLPVMVYDIKNFQNAERFGLKRQVQESKKIIEFILKNSKSEEHRVAALKAASDLIYKILDDEELVNLLSRTDNSQITSGFEYLLKTVTSKEEPSISIELGNGYFDDLSFFMAKMIGASDHASKNNYSKSLCEIFEKIGIKGKALETLDEGDVGCLDLAKKEYRLKKSNFNFNFFAHYFSDGTSIKISGETARGGFFNLSSKQNYSNIKIEDPQEFVDFGAVATVMALRHQNANKFLPICYVYKEPVISEEKIKTITPQSGKSGGDLYIDFKNFDEISVHLTSCASKPQKRNEVKFKAGGQQISLRDDNFISKSPSLYLYIPLSETTAYKHYLKKGKELTLDYDYTVFFTSHVRNVSVGLSDFAETFGFSCDDTSCDVSKLNALLFKRAKEMTEDNEHLFKFMSNCIVPETILTIEEVSGVEGFDGRIIK